MVIYSDRLTFCRHITRKENSWKLKAYGKAKTRLKRFETLNTSFIFEYAIKCLPASENRHFSLIKHCHSAVLKWNSNHPLNCSRFNLFLLWRVNTWWAIAGNSRFIHYQFLMYLLTRVFTDDELEWGSCNANRNLLFQSQSAGPTDSLLLPQSRFFRWHTTLVYRKHLSWNIIFFALFVPLFFSFSFFFFVFILILFLQYFLL